MIRAIVPDPVCEALGVAVVMVLAVCGMADTDIKIIVLEVEGYQLPGAFIGGGVAPVVQGHTVCRPSQCGTSVVITPSRSLFRSWCDGIRFCVVLLPGATRTRWPVAQRASAGRGDCLISYVRSPDDLFSRSGCGCLFPDMDNRKERGATSTLPYCSFKVMSVLTPLVKSKLFALGREFRADTSDVVKLWS